MPVDDVPDLRARLGDAIVRHALQTIRAPLERAAEPQVALRVVSPGEDFGALHRAAHAADPARVPADFDQAMKAFLPYQLEEIVDRYAKAAAQTPGSSRLGGEPELPDELVWPAARDGKHLVFIAQLDLSALPRWDGSALPRTGWLWAFAGGDFPIESAVIHWDGPRDALRRRRTPKKSAMALGEYVEDAKYKPAPVSAAELVVSVPAYGSEWWLANIGEGDQPLADAMFGLSESLEMPSTGARVLGLMSHAAAESPNELARAGGRGGNDWMLLLEIGSVGSMSWGDAGTLVFLIEAGRLTKADFSGTYACVCAS